MSIEHFYPSLNNMEAPVSARGFRDYRDKTKSFESVAVETNSVRISPALAIPSASPGCASPAIGFTSSASRRSVGRVIDRDDDEPGREHVVVLSYGVWTRLFAGKPKRSRRNIELNGETYQIIGVMPHGFYSFYSRKADLFVPLALKAERLHRRLHKRVSESVARLKPGVALAQGAGGNDDVRHELEEAESESSSRPRGPQGAHAGRPVVGRNRAWRCSFCSAPSASCC